MEIQLNELNYLSIIVAVIANQIIGAIWYSPKVFGTAWAKLVGIKMNKIDKKDAQKGMLYSFILAIVFTFLLALILNVCKTHTVLDGVLLGIIIGLIHALAKATNDIYESRPFKHWLITAFYPIVSFAIMGSILGGWV